MALGLPHINSCQVNLAFRDLLKTLVRRHGRPNELRAANSLLAGALSAFVDASQSGTDVSIVLDPAYTPRLRVTYIRLPSFRNYPESAALTVYRREIRRAVGTQASGSFGEKAFNAGLWGGAKSSSVKGLRCCGDFYSKPSSLTVRPPAPSDIANHTVDVDWNGIAFPQPPSYIFICYEKSPAYMTYNNTFNQIDRALPPNGADYNVKFNTGADRGALDDVANINATNSFDGTRTQETVFNAEVAARNIAQSHDCNAAIMQIECVVQSAIGSFAWKDTDAPYLTDRDQLWRKHVRNCHSAYCPKGRSQWQDFQSCALLSSSDYLLGISSSSGTQYPIQLDIKVKFANRAAYSDGSCFTTGASKGQMCFENFILGEPVVVGLFNSNVLTIASSAAVLSAQSFSQSTTAAALASSR